MKKVPAEKGHWAFYIEIFSNMTERQRARYRIARLRHCKQRDVGSV